MEFHTYCGQIYAEELGKDVSKEKIEDVYLNSGAFRGIDQRSGSLHFKAQQRVDNFSRLAMITDREVRKNETGFEKEKECLLSVMPKEDITVATTYSFWRD